MVEYSSRLINPYTRTFVEIPAAQESPYSDCIVVDEKDNDTTYKVAAVVEDQIGREWDQPSQKRWKIAGYLPENVRLRTFAKLFYCNGDDPRGDVAGIGCFTIPLEEGSGSALMPNPIPMHFAPFPRKLRKGARHRQMITCLSRLLVISDNNVSVRLIKLNYKGIIKYFPLICFYEISIKLNFIFILLKLKIDNFT